MRDAVRGAMEQTGQTWKESSALVLRRGPYVVAAGLDLETAAPAVTLKGRFIPLFDASQTVVHEYAVAPGARALLVDLDRYPAGHVGVIAAACRVTGEKVTNDSITFGSTGQADTNAVVSVLLPRAPKQVTVDGKPLPPESCDFSDGVVRLRFPNRTEAAVVHITR